MTRFPFIVQSKKMSIVKENIAAKVAALILLCLVANISLCQLIQAAATGAAAGAGGGAAGAASGGAASTATTTTTATDSANGNKSIL